MKTDTLIIETAALIANIKPMLFTEIKQAEHHSLSEIRMSISRAKEIYVMAIILEKRLKDIRETTAAA